MPNDRYEKTFGEIYCLTFVRGVDETEALLRMGGLADTMRPRSLADVGEEMWSHDAGYPRIAQALSVGSWTVIIEPSGFEGADVQLLNAVSRGTEAVSVLRHDYAEHNFAYSEEGTLVTELAGGSVFRRGSEPDRFLPQMWAVGLDPEGGYGASLVHRHVAALRLVDQITGFLPDIPDGPLPSAHIEPWFSAAEPSASGGEPSECRGWPERYAARCGPTPPRPPTRHCAHSLTAPTPTEHSSARRSCENSACLRSPRRADRCNPRSTR